MQSCHTIYGMPCCDCKVGHLNLTIINDRHTFYLAIITRIMLLDL